MKKKMILLIINFIMAMLFLGCAKKEISWIEEGKKAIAESRYEEAVGHLLRAVEEEEEIEEAFRAMGIIYWEREEYAQAKRYFLRALHAGAKESGTLYNFLAVIELKEENYESALVYFQKGLTFEENTEALNQEMRWNEIAVHEEMRNWEMAKQKVEEYLLLYPDDKEMKREEEFLRSRGMSEEMMEISEISEKIEG